MTAIGIDLGTTYSCVGVVVNGEVKILEDGYGNRTTPSYVAFMETTEMVGKQAKANLPENPENTVFNVKRLIGKGYDEPTLRADLRNLPFKVVNDDGKPRIKINRKTGQSSFIPEEISGMVLKKMKELAEEYLEEKVHCAVITVPAHFSNAKRIATKEAASYAGLHVLHLLNEPTAAAIAYGFMEKSEKASNLLVYDFGGGTLDVSIVLADNGTFKVKATAGDPHMGGEDMDQRMMSWCIKDFNKQDNGTHLDKKRKYELKGKCEEAKKMLSSEGYRKAGVELESLRFSTEFTQVQFEQLNEDLFHESMGYVTQALKDAKLDKSQIDEIIAVGGSTYIPFVRDMLFDFFGKKPRDIAIINPDEAVAYGAAVDAAFLSGNTLVVNELSNLDLKDVIPLSMGIETVGEVMSVVLPRNTEYPTKKAEYYTTVHDYQTSAIIPVYEGERAKTSLNDLLGSFRLTGMTRRPAGVPSIKVFFSIDIDGILNVSAREPASGCENDITIEWNRKARKDGDVARQLKEAAENKHKDEQWEQKIKAKTRLEIHARKIKKLAKWGKVGEDDDDSGQNNLVEQCNDILDWTKADEDLSKEDFDLKYDELEDAYRRSQISDD